MVDPVVVVEAVSLLTVFEFESVATFEDGFRDIESDEAEDILKNEFI